MRWDKVDDDAYYRARKFEFMAKRYEKIGDNERAVECWQKFSELKEKKGSYFLAAFGHFHLSRLHAALGNVERSISSLEKAHSNAHKSELPFSLFISYELAFTYEREGELRKALDCYEQLGEAQERAERYFLAADAYEHAAELRHEIGMAAKTYELPLIAWKKNSEYWDTKGESDDAQWSEERKRYYKALYRQ
jgi:tetratricopeptide (TPR) repeat protein